jgi:hypothetical protein
MMKYGTRLVHFLVVGLLLILVLGGCAAAVGVLGTVGSGVAGGADYLVSTPVSKTVSQDYDQMKKALLVTLCEMVIDVEKASEIEDGEKILAKADDLKVVIELRKITPSLTRIEIKAGGGVVKRDRATASAIVYKTTELAEKLVIQ